MEVECFDYNNRASGWFHLELSIALLWKAVTESPTLQVIAHSAPVWSYWPLSSTCSSSLFASLLLQLCFSASFTCRNLIVPALIPHVYAHVIRHFQGYVALMCLFASVPISRAPVCNDVVSAAAGVCLFTFHSHLEFISDVFCLQRITRGDTSHTYCICLPCVFVFSSISANDKISGIPLLNWFKPTVAQD